MFTELETKIMLKKRNFRDGNTDVVNDSPVSLDSSNPGGCQLGDQITEVPRGDQNSPGRHPRSSTPVLKVTYHQDQSTQANVKQGSMARSVAVQAEQNLPTSQGKKQGTEALVTPSDPPPSKGHFIYHPQQRG